MPGSPTTQDRSSTRVVAPVRFAFRIRNDVGVLDEKYFLAQWLACTLPCSRFAAHLTVCCARLGVGWFATPSPVMDLHHLLLAGGGSERGWGGRPGECSGRETVCLPARRTG
jgi:hypothetical protein